PRTGTIPAERTEDRNAWGFQTLVNGISFDDDISGARSFHQTPRQPDGLTTEHRFHWSEPRIVAE
ncbi:MAG: hypothetical protein KDA66_09815, partial [Planctomycetaceae bacterium]|nr:hypothetical protein [Planctomycetaceae bacterium]